MNIDWQKIVARILDFIDQCFYAFHPNLNAVWDDFTHDWESKHGPALRRLTTVDLVRIPGLDLLRRCPTCKATIRQRCTTADGVVTATHTARKRETAAELLTA